MPPSSRQLRPGVAVRGKVFRLPLGLPVVHPIGAEAKLAASKSAGRVHRRVLNSPHKALLGPTPENEPFDGEAPRRWLPAAKSPKSSGR
jgi:hypothetical protein